MDDIFTQVVRMLVDAKFVSLEVQYIDGTKIEANANKYTFVWKKATKTNQEKLDLHEQTHVQDLGSFSVRVYIVKTRRGISGYCRRGTKDRR